MDLVIKGAVVASIFRDVDHSLEASIEGRAEDPALRFGAAFQGNLSKNFVPTCPSPSFTPVCCPESPVFSLVLLQGCNLDLQRCSIIPSRRPIA